MNLEFSNLSIGVHRFHHECKPGSRTKPLKITIEPDGAVWFCHRCGEAGCERHGSRQPITRSAASTHTTLSTFGRAVWDKCHELAGTALDYLRARHCVIPPTDSDLRWHQALGHPSGHVGPALVGLVTDTITNEPISLHRTWIRADGTKAAVDPPRMLLKGHRKAGGVIRLWPDKTVEQGLAIGEGIETCLAAAHAFTPIWSTIDAGNLSAFPILAGIDALTIYADADESGKRGASICARRWASIAEVTIVTPKQVGADIANVVAA